MQPKLSIGASNDPLEAEADRVADQVLAAPASPPAGATRIRIQRMTGATSAEAGTDTAPASVDGVLASPGHPLEPALRHDLEQRFGHDFSRVRVHADAAASQSARDVNARAYTLGHDIVFGGGQYRPHSSQGLKLLAHELTHVLQQDPGLPSAESGSAAIDKGHGSEVEADRTAGHMTRATDASADAVLAGKPVAVTALAGSGHRSLGRVQLKREAGEFSEDQLQKYLASIDARGIEDNSDSDDKAREIVNAWRLGGSPYVLTARRKALLIREMQSGFTGDDDEQAIIELLERCYNYELSYIFGASGITADDLNSDIHGEEWTWLKAFYARRFKGGLQALLDGRTEPVGDAVPLGQVLDAKSNLIEESENFELHGTGSWNVPCVLGILCEQDAGVVADLPGLKVQTADEVTEVYWQFDGAAWTRKTRRRGAFSKSDEKIIGLKSGYTCGAAAISIVHEVRHQHQNPDSTSLEHERDAYTFTEEWAIARGFPDSFKLRKTDPANGKQAVDPEAVDAYVTARYSGTSAENRQDVIVGHSGTDTRLEKPDGSRITRPSQDGDSHQDIAATKANLQNLPVVDPALWVCPKTGAA